MSEAKSRRGIRDREDAGRLRADFNLEKTDIPASRLEFKSFEARAHREYEEQGTGAKTKDAERRRGEEEESFRERNSIFGSGYSKFAGFETLRFRKRENQVVLFLSLR